MEQMYCLLAIIAIARSYTLDDIMGGRGGPACPGKLSFARPRGALCVLLFVVSGAQTPVPSWIVL